MKFWILKKLLFNLYTCKFYYYPATKNRSMSIYKSNIFPAIQMYNVSTTLTITQPTPHYHHTLQSLHYCCALPNTLPHTTAAHHTQSVTQLYLQDTASKRYWHIRHTQYRYSIYSTPSVCRKEISVVIRPIQTIKKFSAKCIAHSGRKNEKKTKRKSEKRKEIC